MIGRIGTGALATTLAVARQESRRQPGVRAVGSTVRTVTDASYQADVLDQQMPVLVDFWAEWCGPCRLMAPLLEALAEEHADRIIVAKVNVDENPETTRKYDVMSLPAIRILSRGRVVKSILGFKTKSALLSEVESALGIIADYHA
jgi:thioredoxin 1